MTTESNKLNIKAHQKLVTWKYSPSSQEAIRIITALITHKNKPKVIKVAGNVRKTKIGLTNAFKIPSTNATKSAPKNPLTSTPGKR